MINSSLKVSLIGAGPASLLMFKKLTECSDHLNITIFEKSDRLGAGMPYSSEGSSHEHIANVSGNELPELHDDFYSFLKENYPIDYPEYFDGEEYNEYKVIPRLLLGDYLENQYEKLIIKAEKKNIFSKVFQHCKVQDIVKNKEGKFEIIANGEVAETCDVVIISTGHFWRKKHENNVEGWYDSPYPPSKLLSIKNKSVAVRGTSLTAVDAVRTLARNNGRFLHENDKLKYILDEDCSEFKLHMYSTGGHLPAVRFHSEDELYSAKWIMSLKEIYDCKKENNGFVPLDYVFDYSFKNPLKKRDAKFYARIENLSLEEFTEMMMNERDKEDSFTVFRKEYDEAQRSIEQKKSITWKETLSAFSYAMNYPAKHFSAEDMLRLKKVLMPLISIIIAELPQSSAEELMALHDAGILEVIEVDEKSSVKPSESGIFYHFTNDDGEDIARKYDIFVDAIGQQPFSIEEIPFKSLVEQQLVSEAFLSFNDAEKAEKITGEKDKEKIEKHGDSSVLKVPGIQINDYFQTVDPAGNPVENLFVIAVPYIGGLNPDYSGLDFCDTASGVICEKITSLRKDLQ